ncbi:Bifunctional phosphoglucose/phosphomannose isomerase [Sulfuracidifex tepidarius]|uniref:Bifunctional phosphoglucose/phosphomannose isomerase n=2 Tax=Sulfuracidifex tepidarius TaxID=1294262 RepID=A0A510DZS7_9CREN|nr:bifunctional phosphoglucose/phosphomannose isomerase [Sulfuracidifex tepidarius]BBG25378.1 Bifunctional phosphoglucose/phosphomannose isomerase [Sulfuracidifex tepidarius]
MNEMENPYIDWDVKFDEALKMEVPEAKFSKFSFSGIGGSGIIGDIARIFFPEIGNSLEGNETLLAVSYSGNTSETIEDVKRAIQKGSDVIIITSGGILGKFAKEKGIKQVTVKAGSQTRYSFPYLITPLLKIVSEKTGDKLNLERLALGVKEKKDEIVKEGTSLANLVMGKIPVFYSSRFLGIAKRYKQEVNENAKYPAFYGEIPEVNHNEVESYVHGYNLHPVVIYSSEIDSITAEVLHATLVKGFYDDDLMNVSSLMMIGGIMSIAMAESLHEIPDKLYNIPRARELTSNLFKPSSIL